MIFHIPGASSANQKLSGFNGGIILVKSAYRESSGSAPGTNPCPINAPVEKLAWYQK